MLSYEEACRIIRSECKEMPKRVVELDLPDSLHRVLAEDVLSDTDQPPFDNAAMDGIAIRYDPEVRSWNIIGEIAAGNYSDYALRADSCVRIMTGARIPPDADTVIPVEHVVEDDDRLTLSETATVLKGQHIRRRASDLFVGMEAIAKGVSIRANHISMLAACGKARVKVFERLKIGLLISGDELIEVDEKPHGDKIRATNLYALAAAIREAGHEAVNFGIVGDDRELSESRLSEALKSDIDILVTTGGVSVGKYDYIKELFETLGVETKFWRVNIKPGKPILFGSYERGRHKKLVFGLPGNPVSAFVTFNIFVQRVVNSFVRDEASGRILAELTCDLKKKDSKRHFARGLLRFDERKGRYLVEDAGSASSGNMAGLSNANCLIVIEESRINPRSGEMIECIQI